MTSYTYTIACQEFVLRYPLDKNGEKGGEKEGKESLVDKVWISKCLQQNLSTSWVGTKVLRDNTLKAKLEYTNFSLG